MYLIKVLNLLVQFVRNQTRASKVPTPVPLPYPSHFNNFKEKTGIGKSPKGRKKVLKLYLMTTIFVTAHGKNYSQGPVRFLFPVWGFSLPYLYI